MRSVKSKGTKLEKRFFAMLVGLGISGWQKNPKNLLGKPDAVIPFRKLVIFVDGCFWHGCPYCQRQLPKTNAVYWAKKIKRNIELARFYNQQLEQDGWKVVRVWEHEFSDLEILRHRIKDLLMP